MIPKRGQIWRAPSPKTRGGYRYIKIERVYRPTLALDTATVREVSRSGRDVRPDHAGPTGEMISTSFDTTLDTEGLLSSPYEFVK